MHFELMSKTRTEHPHVQPALITLAPACAIVYNCSFELVHDSFLDMIEDGAAPNNSTYRVLIAGYSTNRRGFSVNSEDVMTLFERARTSGIELDLEQYSRLIGILSRTMNIHYWPLM